MLLKKFSSDLANLEIVLSSSLLLNIERLMILK